MSTSTGNLSATDHSLTLSMVKELCMLQRTDKGREVRRYMFAVVDQWNQPDALIARALQMANRKLETLIGAFGIWKLPTADEPYGSKQMLHACAEER